MSNWARTVDNVFAALFLTIIAAMLAAWFIILPTVGLLYSVGVLP